MLRRVAPLLLLLLATPAVAEEDYYAPPFGVWTIVDTAKWQAITTYPIPLTGPDCTYVGVGLGPFMPLPQCAQPEVVSLTLQSASPAPGGATVTVYAFEPVEGYVILKLCDPMARTFAHQAKLIARVACGD